MSCRYKNCKNTPQDNGYCGRHQILGFWKDGIEKDGTKKVCSNVTRGCRNILDKNSKFSKCEECRSKGKIKCKKEGCKNKQMVNGYCMLHQLAFWKEEVEKDGTKKVCVNYIRGCRNLLDIGYSFARCDECREKERCKDKIRRNKVVEQATNTDEDMKLCRKCKQEFKKYCFVNVANGKETNYCNLCREKQRRRESGRVRDKEKAKEYDHKPQRIEKRKKWRAENHEKVALTWKRYREKKRSEDLDGYHAHNNQVIKEWRNKNPEKVIEINKKKQLNMDYRYYYYKHRCETNEIEWKLTYEQCLMLFNDKCYYCGFIDYTLMGIDRMDNGIGYSIDNCVPCCEMCNFMKKIDLYDVFIRKVRHIVCNFFGGNYFYPEVFGNHISVNYNVYRNRADGKKLVFDLNKPIFDVMTSKECYLCGKRTNEDHTNGIDRIDNSKGYTLDNCLPCCGDCNYLKNNYDISKLLCKLIDIYNNFKQDDDKFIDKKFVETVIIPVMNYDLSKNSEYESLKEETETPKKSFVEYHKKYRAKLRAKLGEIEYKKLMADKKREYRHRKNPPKERKFNTPEEKREYNRIRIKEWRDKQKNKTL